MTDRNVQSSRGVTLVGSGEPRAGIVRDLMQRAPDLVAADGGANACRSFGLTPLAVIGDFDSLDPEVRDAMPDTRFLHVSEQDSTDFEKSLTRIDAPVILATGFTAGRIDHTLAVMSSLTRYAGTPVIVCGDADVVFAAPGDLALDLPVGMRLSLFPMNRVTGRSTGLKWSIDDIVLEPHSQIGTSNEVVGPVRLTFDTPGCLVVMPREALDASLATLRDHPGVRGR